MIFPLDRANLNIEGAFFMKDQHLPDSIGSLPRRSCYWNLINEILDQCAFSKAGAKKDLLMAFSNLRNLLHGNGIHKNDSLSIQVNDMSFDLIKGKRVECSSWNHLVVSLESNVMLHQIQL
jgi:hypothetical protein